jgi:hypothetical protein
MEIGPVKFTNTVSGVVFGTLVILIGGLAWLLNGVYKTRIEVRSARQAASVAADTAAEAASTAAITAANTRNVSNGFAGTVTSQLDTIVLQNAHNAEAIDKVQHELTRHLRWHIEKEG